HADVRGYGLHAPSTVRAHLPPPPSLPHHRGLGRDPAPQDRARAVPGSRMTKTSKTTKPRLSVDEWVDAGIELLADEGLAAVKIDRLCKQLGVTKGSFYWHFSDLAAFLAALAERWGELRDARKAAFAEIAGHEPRARIAEMIELLLDPDEWTLERAVREWAR